MIDRVLDGCSSSVIVQIRKVILKIRKKTVKICGLTIYELPLEF